MTTWLRPLLPGDSDNDVPSQGAGARQPFLLRLAAELDRDTVERLRGERDQVRGELAVRDAQRERE